MRTVALAILVTILGAGPAAAQTGRAYDDRNKITVNGEAVVYVKPDRILISLGVETQDKEILVAKQKNNDSVARVLAVIKESGVPAKEIQTDHLSIEPRYRDSYTKADFLFYNVRNTLAVTLDDPSRVESLVTKALQAGVNHIHGIDFQTSQFKKYREQAREMALVAAKEKAEKMAAVLGQSIGEPLSISESGSGTSWYYNSSWSGWGYGRSSGMSQNVAQDMRGGGGSGETEGIALGKISIRAGVAVTFALKHRRPGP
jgi:uncharacterized protein